MTTRLLAARDGSDVVINDFWARVLLSPVLGVVIANSARLIDNARHAPGELVVHYAWFTATAFIVWEGNRRLHVHARSRYPWFERPWTRIAILLGIVVIFTIPVTTALLVLWGRYSRDPSLSPATIAHAVVLAVLGVVIIAHVYESLLMFRYWERDRFQKERLERSRLQAELDALQREVDPHFLYNSLNSLAHLIDVDTPRAATFVEALAASYRYVVDTRGLAFVPLSHELAALERHRVLADIRFGRAVRLDDTVDDQDAACWVLPPLTLQELFENAIKHTEFGVASPLEIRVERVGPELVVSNPRRPRAQAEPSTQRGLANLDERLRLSTGRGARWGALGDRFVVHVPLEPAGGYRPIATS